MTIFALLPAGCQEYTITTNFDVKPGDITECQFTPIADTRMSVYDCNPVFTSTSTGVGGALGEVSIFAQPVLGHTFYQMWYRTDTDVRARPYEINYAVSTDGVEWLPDPNNPMTWDYRAGDFDNGLAQAPSMFWDPVNDEYVSLYQGFDKTFSTNELAARTSPDGRTWTRTEASPFFSLSQAVGGLSACWPLSFGQAPDGSFLGYLGLGPVVANPARQKCEPWLMTATDLNSQGGWAIGDGPLVPAGPEAWDAIGMTGASVAILDGTWYMFYIGAESWTPDAAHPGVQTATTTRLALATSPDGLTWTKSPESPFPIAASKDGRISSVTTQVVGSRIHLWIGDWYADLQDHAVGYFYYEPDVPLHAAE